MLLMDIERIVEFLDHPDRARQWFSSLGIEDTERAYANLRGIADSGMTLDLLAVITGQLQQLLPRSATRTAH